jgi:hypothetical protein
MNSKVFCKHYDSRFGGWFRLFGIGLTYKLESKGLSFSERNGHIKYIKIGKWVISYLPKYKSLYNFKIFNRKQLKSLADLYNIKIKWYWTNRKIRQKIIKETSNDRYYV